MSHVALRAWLAVYLIARVVWHFCRRVFVAEPLLKASCRAYGARVRADIYAHCIQGEGDLVVGDDVLLDGRSVITFRGEPGERPRLIVGSDTGIMHDCRITVARHIAIGSHCRIAAGVWIADAAGSVLEPVTIEDNVWIGGRAIIGPGVIIGTGSVVSAGAVVTATVPPYSLVAGHPARRVGALKPPASAGGGASEERVA